MEYTDEILGHSLLISDDADHVREHILLNGPAVLVLGGLNAHEDTSFARYAVTEDFFELPDDEKRKYYEGVVKRHLGIPFDIAAGTRVSLRELKKSDVKNIIRIYDEAEGWLEPFFSSPEEAGEYLEDYIKNHYDLYGLGIWGVTLNEGPLKSEEREIIGITGISEKGGEAELVYAFLRDFRHKGYALEASRLAIEAANEKRGRMDILISVKAGNESSLKLAGKLESEGLAQVRVML